MGFRRTLESAATVARAEAWEKNGDMRTESIRLASHLNLRAPYASNEIVRVDLILNSHEEA